MIVVTGGAALAAPDPSLGCITVTPDAIAAAKAESPPPAVATGGLAGATSRRVLARWPAIAAALVIALVVRHDIRQFPFKCVERTQICQGERPSKQKRPRWTVFNFLIFLRRFGAAPSPRP